MLLALAAADCSHRKSDCDAYRRLYQFMGRYKRTTCAAPAQSNWLCIAALVIGSKGAANLFQCAERGWPGAAAGRIIARLWRRRWLRVSGAARRLCRCVGRRVRLVAGVGRPEWPLGSRRVERPQRRRAARRCRRAGRVRAADEILKPLVARGIRTKRKIIKTNIVTN